MSTLVAQVRTKTGAAVADASDARIIEALAETSVIVDGIRITWRKRPDGQYSRIGQLALGKYVVEATGATGSVTPIVLASSAGVADTDLSITQTGVVTTSETSGTLPVVYATGRAYDVHAAAAEIVGDMLTAARGAFDFKRGDQTFNRSQGVDNLERLLRRMRAKSIPRRRGEMVMRDQAASSI